MISLTLSRTRSHLIVLLAIFAGWFLLFLTSGSLFSGFHFTDDHDIIAIYHYLTAKQMSVIDVIAQWLKDDHSTGRFRTFYFIHRIVQTKVLGIHFLWWSIYTGLLAVVTTFLFYIFGVLLGFSIQEALLFSLLANLGTQSAIWWQLGPAETIGTFLLSLALVFTTLSARTSRWQKIYDLLAVVFTILMSLSKENFIFMIPAILFIKVSLHRRYRNSSWYQAIRSNALSLIFLLLAFCLEILFVKYVVGLTPEIGYAGFDGFEIGSILFSFNSLSNGGSWWLIALGAVLTIVTILSKGLNKDFEASSNNSGQEKFRSLKLFITPSIFFILIVVPQVIVYAKSGIAQRYLYPGVIAYSLLTICIHRYLKGKSRIFRQIVLSLIVASLVFNLHLVWRNAQIFALEGQSTNALLRSLEVNTKASDPVLVVTNVMVYSEWNLSIKKYLDYIANRDNLYLVAYGKTPENSLSRKIYQTYNNQTLDKLQRKDTVRCIVIFPLLKNAFLRNSSDWFVEQEFNEIVFDHFNRNLNPNSTIHLYCRK